MILTSGILSTTARDSGPRGSQSKETKNEMETPQSQAFPLHSFIRDQHVQFLQSASFRCLQTPPKQVYDDIGSSTHDLHHDFISDFVLFPDGSEEMDDQPLFPTLQD